MENLPQDNWGKEGDTAVVLIICVQGCRDCIFALFYVRAICDIVAMMSEFPLTMFFVF